MDIYQEEIIISSIDADYNFECKLSSLFLYFQDIATKHSDALHSGREDVNEKGMKWVITRFDVEINRMPRYGEKVIMATYPGDSNAIFYYRNFYVEDKDHNIIIKASSLWTILNAKNNSIVKDAFNGRKLPQVHLDNELAKPQKIEIKEGEFIYSKHIRYSDIDLNNHLNNTRYIELIQDAFNLDFYKENRIQFISINYMQEFKADDVVEIYSTKDNPYNIIGKKEDKIHFVSELKFVKR